MDSQMLDKHGASPPVYHLEASCFAKTDERKDFILSTGLSAGLGRKQFPHFEIKIIKLYGTAGGLQEAI
ncbi:unnamed protein product [Calypogeia fissa]